MSALDSIGLGVDVQEVGTFPEFAEPVDARFYERVFSPAEREYCLAQAAPAQHFAVRFAAKEAVVKAMSKFRSLALEEVEVVRGADGRPGVRFLRDDVAGFTAELSLSHSETQAVAVAAVERTP